MVICRACGAENPSGKRFCGECGAKLYDEPVREERKVVTALFCDLVGSTALGERLDAEKVSRLLHDYQEICRGRIESHGGVVEKFIGDAVVGVFGIPAAHEDDPERAVRAALRICDDVAASGLPIEIRLGVDTGEALVRLDVDPRSGEGFVTGDTLNTAARLEAAAPVMSVAVGERTYRASVPAIDFEPLGPIVAKGKADTVSAWRAVAPVARTGDLEMDRTPFVGRATELGVLTRLFDSSRTHSSLEFVTIIAAPGLGKSRLVRQLSRHVDHVPEPVAWRQGRCLPYGDGVSFWALSEIVKMEAGILDTDDQRELAAKLDRVIVEPEPAIRTWIADRLGPLVGLATTTEPQQRDEAFTAWRRFLESIAARGPFVMVIEDLHWADEGFVAFLEQLSERTAELPMVIVVTARPEIEERYPNWLSGQRSTVLRLSPLDRADIEALVARALPNGPTDVISLVVERAGGSPLYAEQLAAMIEDRVADTDGALLDLSLIPESLQALIAARIDALPAAERDVLMQAAVVGTTFWSGAVASLGELNDIEPSLDDLVRRELCRSHDRSTMAGEREFSFWHALVRDVAYAELTKGQRARMHAATAGWILERAGGAAPDVAEIVVHHLDAAIELGSFAPEIDAEHVAVQLGEALFRAAEATMRTDVRRAMPHLERALAMIPTNDARSRLAMLMLARARVAAGEFTAARATLEDVLERFLLVGENVVAVEAANVLFGVLWQLGDLEAGSQLLRDLRRSLGPEPSQALAELIGIEANELSLLEHHDDALQRSRIAISMAEELGLEPPVWAVLDNGRARYRLGDPEGASGMRIAIDRMFELGRPIDGLDAMAALAIEQVSRSPSEGTRTLDEAIRIGERFGLDAPVWALRALRCEFLVTEGRFDALVEESGSVLRWATKSNDAISRLSALRALSVVEGLRGDELIDLDELVELARAFGESGAIVLVDAAAIAASRGDQARARDLLEEASGVVTDAPPSLARKAIELGYPELVGSIEFHQGRNPTEIASASVVDAMLAERRGDLLGAIEGYRGALETFEALGRPIEVARSHQLLGHALLTGGTKRGGSSACARFAGTLGRDGCYTSGTGGRCASRERAAGGDARRCTLLAEASRNVVGSGSLLPRWIG